MEADWLLSILDERSQHYFKKWSGPDAPAFLFDHDYGIFRCFQVCEGIYHKNLLIKPLERKKILERICWDMGMLYGLRNGVVHSGNRSMSENFAAYLGRAGLEILFAAMGKEAEDALLKTFAGKPERIKAGVAT